MEQFPFYFNNWWVKIILTTLAIAVFLLWLLYRLFWKKEAWKTIESDAMAKFYVMVVLLALYYWFTMNIKPIS
jgi:membrane protein insertase Oxa1/YidC/SpoIIIJ